MDCRRRSRRPRLQAFPEQLEPAEASPEARIVARTTLDRALGDLPEGRREALLQHHYLGLSFREIGLRVGTTASAAKLRASRGLAALRTRLLGTKE